MTNRKTEKKRVARKTKPLSKKKPLRKATSLSKKKRVVRKTKPLSKKKKVLGGQETNKIVLETKEQFKAIQRAKETYGMTPLIWASKNGHESIVNDLLRAGVNVNARDNYDNTALIWASNMGHEEIVKALLKKGADVNAQDNTKMTALMWASNMGHEEIVNDLLQAGADVNAKDERERTALMYTYKKNIAEDLLKKDMKTIKKDMKTINMKDYENMTALMIASLRNDNKMVEVLLEKGADVNVENKMGRTALDLAAVNGHTNVLKRLLSSVNEIKPIENAIRLVNELFEKTKDHEKTEVHENIIKILKDKKTELNELNE